MDKEMLRKQIGENLYKARTKKKLSQKQVAKAVGITPVFYGNIERGEKMLSVSTLCALADALDVTTDSLVSQTDYDDTVEVIGKLLRDQPQEIKVYVLKLTQLCLKHSSAILGTDE